MAGDATPVVRVPLTDGFARTGFEQQQTWSDEADRPSKLSAKANNNVRL